MTMSISMQSGSHPLNGRVRAESWVLRSENRSDMNIVRSVTTADNDMGVDLLIFLLQSM